MGFPSDRWLLVFLLLVVSTGPARAHDGPPYPILVDEKVGPLVVSVWTDPDVGIGTFWVFLQMPDGSDIPENTTVQIHVRPTDDRLPEASHPAHRQDARGRTQFYAEVPFDAEGSWHVRFTLHSSAGNGEVATQVEVTPPGYGRWDLLIYLFPFALLAALWAYGVLRHGRRRSAESS